MLPAAPAAPASGAESAPASPVGWAPPRAEEAPPFAVEPAVGVSPACPPTESFPPLVELRNVRGFEEHAPKVKVAKRQIPNAKPNPNLCLETGPDERPRCRGMEEPAVFAVVDAVSDGLRALLMLPFRARQADPRRRFSVVRSWVTHPRRIQAPPGAFF